MSQNTRALAPAARLPRPGTLRTGLVIIAVISVAGVIPGWIGASDPVSVAIGAVTTAFAIAVMVLLVPAWRGGRAPALAIGILGLVSLIGSLPAFFLPAGEVPASSLAFAIIGDALTVLAFVLVLRGLPERR